MTHRPSFQPSKNRFTPPCHVHCSKMLMKYYADPFRPLRAASATSHANPLAVGASSFRLALDFAPPIFAAGPLREHAQIVSKSYASPLFALDSQVNLGKRRNSDLPQLRQKLYAPTHANARGRQCGGPLAESSAKKDYYGVSCEKMALEYDMRGEELLDRVQCTSLTMAALNADSYAPHAESML